MKTVLHILNTNSYSGAENVAITLIRAMNRLYPGYRLIYVSPDGLISERLASEGVAFEPVSALSVREVRRVVKKYRPDVIHAHDFTASVVSAISTLGIPIISHIHNNVPWFGRLCVRSLAYGICSLRCRKILCVSPSVKDEFIFSRLISKKAEVIGNPIDTAKIRRAADEAEIKDGYDVVFLGRLTDAKNPELFLEVLGDLAKKMSLSAVMIGEGEKRSELEKLIADKNLSDTVSLKGFLDNPYGILASSRLLLMTSSWEGYGLVAVEALALGKPVVALPVGGIPTIITGGEGRLAADKDGLVSAVEALLTNPDEYGKASQLAKARAEEIDNLSSYAEKINRYYSGE